jgi:hypothetical protein
VAKKPQELGCSLAFLIIGLPVFIIFQSLPYLMLAVFYSYPAFLTYLFVNSPKRRQPGLADIGDKQIEAEIRAFHAERSQLLKEISETRERGTAEGVRFLYPLDRFEMRSRRGQELNQSLEYLSALLANVVDKIKFASTHETRHLLAWQKAVQRWRHRRCFRLAFYASLAGLVGCTAFLEVYYSQSWIKPPEFLIWNPFPGIIRYTVEIGAIAGWVCGLLTLYFSRRYNRRLAESEGEDRFDGVVSANDGARSHDDRNDYVESDRDPYQVLNVSSGASAEEIRNAYRAAIKRCHPDTVADRSDRIKEAALEEAQLINDAYNRIRSERGFV